MPLFTTKPTDQFFERFMKHHVSPAGSGVAPSGERLAPTEAAAETGAKRCPPDTSAPTDIQTPPKPTASRQNWTQKKKGRKHTP